MKVWLHLFYRKINIEGQELIPKKEPILLIPNHQNALMDALLIGAFFPRNIYFLARFDVFKPWIKPLLNLLKMMPVYRIRDGFAQLKNNDQTFNACFNLFKMNKNILIFPEGNHGEHHYLRPLTKGSSRLALQAQEKISNDLWVLPVGINYYNHRLAKTSVCIVYGNPIRVHDFSGSYKENSVKGILNLRDQMTRSMKEVLVFPENSEDYEKKKSIVFQEKNNRLSFQALRNLAAESHDDVRIKPQLKRRTISRVLNPFPFWTVNRITSKLKDIVFTSTTKFAVGLLTFPLWWLFLILIITPFLGLTVSLSVVGLMIICLLLDI